MALMLVTVLAVLAHMFAAYMFTQMQRANRELITVLVAENAPRYTHMQRMNTAPAFDEIDVDDDGDYPEV